jgi:hypothetical protein
MGDPKGWRKVDRLVETDSPEPISNARFVDYLTSIHDGKTLNDPARGLSSATPGQPGQPAMTINDSLGHIKQAWTPVQCENCHGPGENHPMSNTYSKVVENQVCLSCHTPTRAPEWYTSDGKPDLEKIKAKHAQVSCPAGDMSP